MYDDSRLKRYSSAQGVVALCAAQDVEGTVAVDLLAGCGVGAADRSGRVMRVGEVGFFAYVGEPCVGDAVAVVVVWCVVAVGGADDTSAYLHGVKVG